MFNVCCSLRSCRSVFQLKWHPSSPKMLIMREKPRVFRDGFVKLDLTVVTIGILSQELIDQFPDSKPFVDLWYQIEILRCHRAKIAISDTNWKVLVFLWYKHDWQLLFCRSALANIILTHFADFSIFNCLERVQAQQERGWIGTTLFYDWVYYLS